MNNGLATEKKRGINRFDSKQTSDNAAVHHEHAFDYSLQPSSRATRDGKPSVRLEYRNYQSRLSLWHSMTDELRIVPLSRVGHNSRRRPPQVMIGLGSMAWSGGVLNASPFCLWREEEQQQQQQ